MRLPSVDHSGSSFNCERTASSLIALPPSRGRQCAANRSAKVLIMGGASEGGLRSQRGGARLPGKGLEAPDAQGGRGMGIVERRMQRIGRQRRRIVLVQL